MTIEDGWETYLVSALALSGAARRDKLSTLCLVGDSLILTSKNKGLGLPVSRPNSRLIRLAAEALIDDSPDGRERVFGLVFRHWRRPRTDEQDSLHWADLESAIALSTDLGDEHLAIWALTAMVSQLVGTQRTTSAVAASALLRERLRTRPLPGFGPFSAAPALWAESGDVDLASAVISYYGWSAVRKASRYSGDLDGWTNAIIEGKLAASRALASRRTLYVAALVAEFEQQRNIGDQSDLSPLEALRDGSFDIEGRYLSQLGFNASARGDRKSAIEAHSKKVELTVATKFPVLAGLSPRQMTDYFDQQSESVRRSANSVANASYEIAVNFIESGRSFTYPEDRVLALAWLDLAASIWRSWGTNGYRAVTYRKAILLIDDEPERVDDLLEVARNAPRPGLRSNSIRNAVLRAADRRSEILEQLDTMLDESWSSTQRAVLLSTRAWATRPGELDERPTHLDDALASLDLLASRPAGSLESIARAGAVIALSGERLNNLELARSGYVENLNAVGRMLLNATTSEQVVYIARNWSQSLRSAMDFAQRQSDVDLADLIAEIVRRDGIGPLLAEVAANPQTPSEAADSAVGASRAGTKDGETFVAEDETAAPPTDTSEEGDERLMRSGAELTVARDEAAYATAKELLGQLGSLSDPATLYSATASTVLAARASAPGAFLLQFLPSTLQLIGSTADHVIYRRLTWSDDEGQHEILDAIPAPTHLVVPSGTEDPFEDGDALTLLPEPLLDALHRADRHSPVRLLLVPTGLFHVSFELLKVDARYLLEVAALSVHTSLTSAYHALSTPRHTPTLGAVAMLDTSTFASSLMESEALNANFPDVYVAKGKRDLEQISASADSRALFALAAHGYLMDDGWDQAKQLPDGTLLSAAEVFGYRFPELCVLASCFSAVAESGVDRAGFPTALFARGARTVIGAIGYLYDGETSEILSLFYEELRSSHDPIASLREARLRWIEADPIARIAAKSDWGRLVAYGGAHF